MTQTEAEALGQAASRLLKSSNPSDVTKAVSMLHEASEGGDSDSTTSLGFMYMEGKGGMPQDANQAIRLFTQAADRGNRDAAFNLGVIKLTGKGGGDVDKYTAAKYFKAAADLGHVRSMVNLSMMLMKGDGIPKDVTLGAQWMAKSAEAEGRLQELIKKAQEGSLDPVTEKKITENMRKVVDMDPSKHDLR